MGGKPAHDSFQVGPQNAHTLKLVVFLKGHGNQEGYVFALRTRPSLTAEPDMPDPMLSAEVALSLAGQVAASKIGLGTVVGTGLVRVEEALIAAEKQLGIS